MSRRCSPLLAAAAALWVADLELETPGGVKVNVLVGISRDHRGITARSILTSASRTVTRRIRENPCTQTENPTVAGFPV